MRSPCSMVGPQLRREPLGRGQPEALSSGCEQAVKGFLCLFLSSSCIQRCMLESSDKIKAEHHTGCGVLLSIVFQTNPEASAQTDAVTLPAAKTMEMWHIFKRTLPFHQS